MCYIHSKNFTSFFPNLTDSSPVKTKHLRSYPNYINTFQLSLPSRHLCKVMKMSCLHKSVVTTYNNEHTEMDRHGIHFKSLHDI